MQSALPPSLATKRKHMLCELEGLGVTVDDVAASVLGSRDEFSYKALNNREVCTKEIIPVVPEVGLERQFDEVRRVGDTSPARTNDYWGRALRRVLASMGTELQTTIVRLPPLTHTYYTHLPYSTLLTLPTLFLTNDISSSPSLLIALSREQDKSKLSTLYLSPRRPQVTTSSPYTCNSRRSAAPSLRAVALAYQRTHLLRRPSSFKNSQFDESDEANGDDEDIIINNERRSFSHDWVLPTMKVPAERYSSRQGTVRAHPPLVPPLTLLPPVSAALSPCSLIPLGHRRLIRHRTDCLRPALEQILSVTPYGQSRILGERGQLVR